MVTLLLATLMGGDLMPTKPGSFWKFRVDDEKESVWKLSPVPGGKITLVEWAEPGESRWENMKWVEIEGGAENHFALMDGDVARFIVKNTGDEIRIYRHEFGNWYAIYWVLRTDDLQNGRTFHAPRAFAGCGFSTRLVPHTVTTEKVVLPAGEFHAFRIEGDRGEGSLWLVPGIGIVKMTDDRSTFELAEWGVPKGGR